MEYRKKPVVIEAIKFDCSADIHELCGNKVREPVGEDYVEIETLEGIMKANKGDYIIKGINGEFYPCKPDIFEKTYEPVYLTECIWIYDGVCVNGDSDECGAFPAGGACRKCKFYEIETTTDKAKKTKGED